MTEIIFKIRADDVDGGYVATALGAKFDFRTQAETIADVKIMIADALRCHFDAEAAIPKIIRLHFVKDELLTLN